MKNSVISSFKFSLAIMAFASLLACGGGGDVAGDSGEFFTSPKETELKVAEDGRGGCSAASGAETFVTIVGGRPPYRIQNPQPKHVRIDRTEATGKDPIFKVTSLGGCVDPATILVLDYHSKSTVFEYKVTAEKATAAVP